jgi:putative ABC transport system ATP-binding protein
MNPPLLSARGLVKNYRLGARVVEALRGVDLDLRNSDFVVLQGPSGSGKSTLLHLLGLLDAPDRGTIEIEGIPAGSLDDDGRAQLRNQRFGFVFQTFNLVPVLTAEENVSYPCWLAGMDKGEASRRARALLDLVGLNERFDTRPDLLSGGQRQRVAIARALANSPKVVFADEPTANLDSGTAAGILELMRELNQARGVAFLVATHDPRVAAYATRIETIEDGLLTVTSG